MVVLERTYSESVTTMNKPALFSDLDQTLVYSWRSMAKHGQPVAGNICVEQINDEPWTFLSLNTWMLLSAHAGKTFDFIPVTTRTSAQFERLNIPNVKFDYAVILNGAKLLVNGEEDKEWTERVKKLLQTLPVTPDMLHARVVNDLRGWSEVKSITNADSSFIYVVGHDADDMSRVESYMEARAASTGYVYSKQGRKVYLLPPNLTKGAAVAELKERLGSTRVYSTGDTLLDFTMHAHSDLFVRPFHAEEFDGVGHHTTTKFGVNASEDILEAVLDDIEMWKSIISDKRSVNTQLTHVDALISLIQEGPIKDEEELTRRAKIVVFNGLSLENAKAVEALPFDIGQHPETVQVLARAVEIRSNLIDLLKV